MLEVRPVPLTKSVIAFRTGVGVATATSGSPISKSFPLLTKYFNSSPVRPITKVFGLAGVSLREEMNAGTTSRFPLDTSEFAPPVIAQKLVIDNEKIATKTVTADSRWP
ncbi:unannotated protein [freshwater metagenome]|uniref:Unannotated protein n=1 Tax=freshwater metagenome TaxID=449393 RepID=A0A6J6UXH2_9ZZZZ